MICILFIHGGSFCSPGHSPNGCPASIRQKLTRIDFLAVVNLVKGGSSLFHLSFFFADTSHEGRIDSMTVNRWQRIAVLILVWQRVLEHANPSNMSPSRRGRLVRSAILFDDGQSV